MKRKLAILVIGALLLSACSSVGLIYRQLDWLIPWYLDDYVSLNDEQSALLDRRLAALLAWHRAEQLSQYSALIGVIRSSYADGLDAAELQRLRPRLEMVWDELIERLLPDLDALAAELSAEQIDELLVSFRQNNNHQFKQDYLQGPLEQRRRRRLERIETQFERWLGPLGNAQRQLLGDWSLATVRDAELSIAYRERWQQQLRQTLLTTDRTRRRLELKALLTEPATLLKLPDEISVWYQNRSQRFNRLLLDIDRLTNASQREHLLKRLERLSADFGRLASG